MAAAGARTRRNLLALVLAIGGAAVLTSVQLAGQPLGLAFAFANCAGFMIYIMLGHRFANTAAGGGDPSGLPLSGIDQLGLSMLIAAAVATPFGIGPAARAFTHPAWLLWGVGVGVIVLAQVPTARDLAGIGLVILGVALHRAVPSGEDEPASSALNSGSGEIPEVSEVSKVAPGGM